MPRIEHTFEDGIEKKWCGKCKTFKSLECFGYSSSTWDNFRPTCKECLKAHNSQQQVKEAKTAYNKQYWEATKDEQKAKSKQWREENKDYIKEKNKEWRENNKELKKKIDKLYREANWERIKESHRKWTRENYQKMKNDIAQAERFAQYKIKSNISRRIREILRQGKSETCLEYTGCSLEKLLARLESTMTDGMNWWNYGSNPIKGSKHCWHIEHILPTSCFDMNNEVEVKACFHFKNLRAYWWHDNIIKYNTYEMEGKRKYLRWFIETQIPYI